MQPQPPLDTPDSQAPGGKAGASEQKELLELLADAPDTSNLHSLKLKVEKQMSDQWFQDHAQRGCKPYY